MRRRQQGVGISGGVLGRPHGANLTLPGWKDRCSFHLDGSSVSWLRGSRFLAVAHERHRCTHPQTSCCTNATAITTTQRWSQTHGDRQSKRHASAETSRHHRPQPPKQRILKNVTATTTSQGGTRLRALQTSHLGPERLQMLKWQVAPTLLHW